MLPYFRFKHFIEKKGQSYTQKVLGREKWYPFRSNCIKIIFKCKMYNYRECNETNKNVSGNKPDT